MVAAPAPAGRAAASSARAIRCCWSLDDPREDGLVAVEYPYFEMAEPLEWDDDITYVDIGDHRIEHGRTQEWNHGLGESSPP